MLDLRNKLFLTNKLSQYALSQSLCPFQGLLRDLLSIVEPFYGRLYPLAIIDGTLMLGPKFFDLLISQIINKSSA
jgi:hypothetical protein